VLVPALHGQGAAQSAATRAHMHGASAAKASMTRCSAANRWASAEINTVFVAVSPSCHYTTQQNKTFCWDLRSRTSHIDIFIGCHLYIDICFIDKLSDALSSVCYGDVRMAMI